MSQENVGIYRQSAEACILSEREAEAALAPLLAPDFRIENAATAVTDNSYYGLTGCLEWRADLSDGFAPGARYVVEEVIADTDELVVGRWALVGTGARSGAPLHLRWISVIWFHDGKAAHGVGYGGRREALKAVGLE